MPTSAHALCLFLTYVAEAGSSPTRTVARHGTMPSDDNSLTADLTLSFTDDATRIPSIFCPVKQTWMIFWIFNLWRFILPVSSLVKIIKHSVLDYLLEDRI